MASHFRLYSRPLAVDEVDLPLSVTGELEGYVGTEAYESRLSINNSVGRCSVKVLESTLPPGAVVRVDNVTKQVVVKWAAYEEVVDEETLLPNGDFELGDDGTWFLGDGWQIGTYDSVDGTKSARFGNVKTKGSDMVSPLFPALLNDYIRVTAQIQQGASSKGNAGARVSVLYYDTSGKELQRNWGNLITSGKDGNWNVSTAEGGAPKDTAGVRVVVSAYRNKQNKPLFVDQIKWNHKYVIGQNSDESYFLRLVVTDGQNRTAEWQGYISERMNYYTSRPYGQYEVESVLIGVPLVSGSMGVSLKESLAQEEISIEVPSLASYSWTTASTPYAYGLESTDIGVPVLLSGDMRSPLITAYGSESTNINLLSVVSGDMKTLLLPTSSAEEAINIGNLSLISGGLV